MVKKMVNNAEGRKKYIIAEEHTMGVCLKPEDIKGLKAGNVDISHAWCTIRDGEIFIVNMRIKGSAVKNEEGKLISPDRKLLEQKEELNRIIKTVFKEKLVIVPLELALNEDGKLKVVVGVGKKNPSYVAPERPAYNGKGNKKFNGKGNRPFNNSKPFNNRKPNRNQKG